MSESPPLDVSILSAVHDSAESLEIVSGMVGQPPAEVAPVLRELWRQGLIAPDRGDTTFRHNADLDDLWFKITQEGRAHFESVAPRYWDE